MNQNVIIHVVEPGDTLYSLAEKYNTTVDTIMGSNPYLEPNRLVIGDQIIIYSRQNGINNCISEEKLELIDNVRALLDDHMIFERSLIVSVADNLRDINVINERMLNNAVEIGNLFRIYYGNDIADRITTLFRNHSIIGGRLIEAYKRGDAQAAETLNREWTQNASNIAEALSGANPYYIEAEVRRLMNEHLELVKQLVSNRFAANYQREADTFDAARNQIIMMADYFSNGIIEQYPKRFN